MNSKENLPLKVLNASAGSGKTHNLVKEYLLLLLADEKDVIRFSRIIAMTFTNKAAIEMKKRIIETLDKLSYPEIYLEKSVQAANDLQKVLKISNEQIHARSKKVLQNILHRYEDFFVMTIDKFNLKLIRSFSRDLDLPNDFEVILNESEVIEQVVDLMLDQIGRESIGDLTKIVFEYAKTNLEEGEKWNVRAQLIEFGKILSKEGDQELLEKLMKLDFSIDRFKELKSELKQISAEAILKSSKTYQFYQSLGIPIGSLPGASTTANAFEKIANLKEFPKVMFTPAFINKCNDDSIPKGKIFPVELRQTALDLQNYFDLNVGHFFVLKKYLGNFYNMALLQYMAKSMDAIKKNEQLIRISEFNKLISDLVKNEDAPFIYERLGTRFQHFLLDEFQDTSRLQWLNMVPLVHESISNNNRNLIVGDPKQSIYRFKNGLAEQFVELPKIYNPENDAKILEKSTYFDKMGFVESLDTNWRSSPIIVDFNNAFFPILKEQLPEVSKEFYNSIFQNAHSELPGIVDFISVPEKKADDDIVPMIIQKIQECEADGFKRGDICILSDLNFRANKWAIALTKAGYNIVSAESLLVQNEIKVKLIIAYLKRRLNPSNSSEQKRFAELFFRINKEISFESYRNYFKKVINEEGKEISVFEDERFLTDHFGSRADFFCKYENLYDLIQSFFKLMSWDELKNPYLHHFADFAFTFELAKGPDLKSFISFYNEKRSSLAIQLPESDTAIKIMTIHKSKGLEFPVVIIPFMDFSTAIRNTSKFLIEVDDKILYTTLSKDNAVDEISDFTKAEMAQIITDKVNMCYVGFTRPIERLYIFNHFEKNNFGSLLHSCLEMMPSKVVHDDGSLSITLGERSRHQETDKTKSTSFFNPISSKDNLWFPDISLQDSVELMEPNQLSREQRFGNQFHLIMANLNDVNQIESVIQELIDEGLVEIEFKNELTSKILAVFNLDAFKQLFEGAIEIMNEQSIIMSIDEQLRPDKIIIKKNETAIIDYKTGLPNNKHVKQIQSYKNALHDLGYENVSGYLYYTAINELQSVV